MSTNTIFTLEARENIFLEVLGTSFNLDSAALYKEINQSFKSFISELAKKGIAYQDLKDALIPISQKTEMAFVFDTAKIESCGYGFEVFSILMPLMDKRSINSVLCGDYLGRASIGHMLRSEFLESIVSHQPIDYFSHDQFYIVYINNLSAAYAEALHLGLKKFRPYIGYSDLTYSSFIKTYLSTILVRLFVKFRDTIITGNEGGEDENIYNYPFEESGYNSKCVEALYYDLFLSYKIEREIFPGFESDTKFSINAITQNVFDISDFKLVIEGKKLKYLLTEKGDNFKRAGLINLTLEQLELFVREKIKSNYIYNLDFRAESQTIKFNILIEAKRTDKEKPMKLTVALEYQPIQRVLRLITMF